MRPNAANKYGVVRWGGAPRLHDSTSRTTTHLPTQPPSPCPRIAKNNIELQVTCARSHQAKTNPKCLHIGLDSALEWRKLTSSFRGSLLTIHSYYCQLKGFQCSRIFLKLKPVEDFDN